MSPRLRLEGCGRLKLRGVRRERSSAMRSLLSVLLALVVALLAVLCALALEPARWAW